MIVVALAAGDVWGQQALDVTGTWTGAYQAQGGNAGKSTLVLKPEGDRVTGTIQVTNVDRSFGSAAQPIQDGRSSGRKLTFDAKGADGSNFSADFSVSRDGAEVGGWSRHTGPGYDATVSFTHKRAK